MSEILLVDDDTDALESLTRALSGALTNTNFRVANTVAKALSLADEHKPHVCVIDLSIDPELGVESGYELLEKLIKKDKTSRVIVLTGHGDNSFGIRAIKSGASSFLVKPADIDHLSALISDGVRQSTLLRELGEDQDRSRSHYLLSEIVGESDQIKRLREQIQFSASTHQPLLILGETGVGKGLCARVVHELSSRRDGSFVRYQPGLSANDILASELFGHEKGAFTGAESSRDGLLKRADGGSFFLDELDGLPMETQVALLGVLQDKKYRSVGSDKEQEVDLRFITATNGDIESLIAEKRLREDLVHRVAHSQITVPSLRERKGDIPLLVDSFIEQLSADGDVGFIEYSNEALQKLSDYDWPGNIRELKAVVEDSCYRAQFNERSIVSEQDLNISGKLSSTSIESSEDLHTQVQEFKQKIVREALERVDNNQSQAAKSLGIDRTTLRRILEK